ncbi:DUF1330 domain-containing protein [Octadecabacter sp.]|nr:DUF1330 domain-containing protein [Octadecabacter sp.]
MVRLLIAKIKVRLAAYTNPLNNKKGFPMPKGYMLSAHRSEANAAKKAAYNLLARDALELAGGQVIVMAKPGSNLSVRENGIEQSTVIIEFQSYELALAAYESPQYQEALAALDGGADRDVRIFEGL